MVKFRWYVASPHSEFCGRSYQLVVYRLLAIHCPRRRRDRATPATAEADVTYVKQQLCRGITHIADAQFTRRLHQVGTQYASIQRRSAVNVGRQR